jgi:hypothetical protein
MTFEEWVRAFFDRPEGWDPYDAEDLPESLDNGEMVALSTQLFLNAPKVLARFSDAQVNQGFWALLGAGQPYMLALLDPHLELSPRTDCVRAIETVFTGVFAKRCDESLASCDDDSNPLNSACYMWWDIFPPGPSPIVNRPALEVMRRTLDLPHAACQESALHGLGHWRSCCPDNVEAIISGFLKKGKARRPELIDYAEHARLGMVQ